MSVKRLLTESVPPLSPVLLLPATVEKFRGRSIATTDRNTSGETMKIHLILALVGLALSLALPSFAQQTVDPKVGQQIRALASNFDAACNRNDAAAVAALYTNDGVTVLPWGGGFHGRQAIEKGFAGVFQSWHPTNQISKFDRLRAAGNEVRSNGRWSHTTYETGGAPSNRVGSFVWIIVREGDTWKIRKGTFWDTTSQSAN
jgi:uncharacterized protein (TIGR02246 family)